MAHLPRFMELAGTATALDARGRFYTLYQLKISRDGGCVELLGRRYRTFQELNDRIRALPRAMRPDKKDLPRLTGKKFWATNLREDIVDKRKRKLPEYVREISALATMYPAIAAELQRFYDEDDHPGGADDDDERDDADGELDDAEHGAGRPSVALPAGGSAGGSATASPLAAVAALTATASATSGTSAMSAASARTLSSPSGVTDASASTAHARGRAPDSAVSPTFAPNAKCTMCDRMITKPNASASWDATKFCSQQCAAFHAAATTKGFAVTSVDGKRALESTASHEAPTGALFADTSASREKATSFSGNISSWWGGRRGSAAPSGADTPAHGSRGIGGSSRDAGVPEGSPPGGGGAPTSRRSLLSAMLGRAKENHATPKLSAAVGDAPSSDVELDPDEIVSAAARAAALTSAAPEAEAVKRSFEQRRRSVRDNSSVLARFKVNQGRSSRGNSLQPAPALLPGYMPVATAPTAMPPSETHSSVLRSASRIFGFGGADTHTAPPPPKAGASGPTAMRVELVHHRGMMWKRGATGLKTWKIRFFELKDWSLYYYRTSNHVLLGRMQLIAEPSQSQLLSVAAELRAVGADVSSPEFSEVLFKVLEGCYFAEVHELSPTELESVSVPSALQRKAGARPLVFAVLTPDRDLVCGCSTQEEYSGWVNGIRRLVRNEQQRLLAIVRSAFPRPSNRGSISGLASPTLTPPISGVTASAEANTVQALTSIPSPPVPRWEMPAPPHAAVVPSASRGASTEPALVRVDTAERAPVVSIQATEVPATASTVTAAARALQTTASPGHERHRSLSVSEAAALVAAHAMGRTQAPSPSDAVAAGSAVHAATGTNSTMSAAEAASAAASKIMGVSRQSSIGSPAPTAGHLAAAAAIAHTWEIAETDVEVVDRIGGGNFGEVYRGRLWGTDVAVKLLISAAVTPDILDDLKAEVAILSQLRHPNVVLYLGACTTPPNIFIVTEWCERGSLHSLLYDHTVPMSVANRLGLAMQTAQGMCYLHAPRRKIIHRDLKSHNLLVTRDFTVKVADFGLTIMRTSNAPQRKFAAQQTPAIAGPHASSRVARSTEQPSKSGVAAEEDGNFYGVQGTPQVRAHKAARSYFQSRVEHECCVIWILQWMAPEVLEGQRYNGSVDVYSFGVVLSELTSRVLPFSDVYKRFDFIDAVLEEGAMPTIPRWCGDVAVPDGDYNGDEDEAPAVSAEGLPWGWRDDLDVIGALPPPPPSVPIPLLGTHIWHEGRNRVPAITPAPPRKTSQDSDNVSMPGDPKSLRRIGSEAPGMATPAGGSVTGGLGHLRPATIPVLGGVSEWHIARGESTGVLRMMIESCLNRDPDLRPSFDDIVDLLRALIDRPVTELFQQLEVPRLREALCYGDDTGAAVAANEIVHFASYALFCNMTVLPDRGTVALAGQESILYGAARQTVRFDPPDIDDTSSGPSSSAHLRGLIIKFQPFSTGFQPLLAFAPPPSAVMSHMHSMPYVDLATVQQAAPELLAGLAARLRTMDLYLRARVGLPLYCPDMSTAVAAGGDHGGYTVVRHHDGSHAARIAVCVSGFPLDTMLSELQATTVTSPTAQAGAHGSAPSTPAGPAKDVVKRSTTMARAAARRAAAQEEDERKKRRAAIASMAHLAHAIGVLLNVMDAGSAAPTAAAVDTGGEIATTAAGYRRLLPPAGSTDRLLLSHASRIVFPLASMLAAQALSHVEYSFITRPTGGESADWRHRYRCVTEFPPMPDFGSDAPLFAATLLRQLWTRLPMLRTVIAHVVTVTAIATASGLGTVQVLAQRIADGDAGEAADWFAVQVPEETVQARFFGVILNRLASAIGVDPGQRAVSATLRRHALVGAVEHRVRATTMKRADGIILGSAEIDEFDATLY